MKDGLGKGRLRRAVAVPAAIAIDYEANIAAAAALLGAGWNQLRAAGITAGGGNPAHIENWYFAIWADNPADTAYAPDRPGFLDSSTKPAPGSGA